MCVKSLFSFVHYKTDLSFMICTECKNVLNQLTLNQNLSETAKKKYFDLT